MRTIVVLLAVTSGLVEGPTWNAWWIQNSYGASYCAAAGPPAGIFMLLGGHPAMGQLTPGS